jgi:hypothetical protein
MATPHFVNVTKSVRWRREHIQQISIMLTYLKNSDWRFSVSLMSQYIFSLLTFVLNNREKYFANFEIHNINTRHTLNPNLPREHLNIYQKWVYYSGINIVNSLPRDIKTHIDNLRTFKKAVKKMYVQTPFTH